MQLNLFCIWCRHGQGFNLGKSDLGYLQIWPAPATSLVRLADTLTIVLIAITLKQSHPFFCVLSTLSRQPAQAKNASPFTHDHFPRKINSTINNTHNESGNAIMQTALDQHTANHLPSPPKEDPSAHLLEIAWEVCNQVGGIYTVIRSKIPAMIDRWAENYTLIGPYNEKTASVEFEPLPLTGAVGQAVQQLRSIGIFAHYGTWLVEGKPNVILIDHSTAQDRVNDTKTKLYLDHHIQIGQADELINQTVAFGESVRILLWFLTQQATSPDQFIAHFHEWMSAGTAIPQLRKDQWPGTIVFTTHATLIGRYIAMNDENFYSKLEQYDAQAQAKSYNVLAQHHLEKAAAHGAQVFTTVSDVTADECTHLLGRTPDVLLPNGLNIQRFAAIHEFQKLHQTYKEKIHNFTMGHFFPSYRFDLENTLYFYTSGRYEYKNKGMDLTIEALARLNHMLKDAIASGGKKITIVMFIVTRRPIKSINVRTLEQNAMLEEFRRTSNAIQQQIGDALFKSVTHGKVPDLNSLVDDYWLLRLKRTLHAWKSDQSPAIVTHDLVDDQNDQVLEQLRNSYLWNQEDDPVKIIYHPEFINPANTLFGMDYDQFVRGMHLGIFPSNYEPWGYTPLESIALGVPAITSDVSGFGSYIQQLLPDHENQGLYVLQRKNKEYFETAQRLADRLFRFSQTTRRQRVSLRNNIENFSVHFDWHNLGSLYHQAHELALDRIAKEG